MSANVGDPYVFSSYSLPSKNSRKGKEKASFADETPFVFASHSGAGKKRDGLVSIAAQGDGVHILDLSDLHPVSSHILGPSTSFATPAVTLVSIVDGKSVRNTYVAVHSAPDVANQDEQKTIWSWREDATNEIGSSPEKMTHVLSHSVSFIATCEGTIPRLFFVSESGQVTQTDLNLVTQKTWTCPGDNVKIVKFFVFPCRSCSFGDNRLPKNGSVLVLFFTNEKGLQLQVLAFSNDNEQIVLEPEDITEKSDDVVDISVSASGFVSLLHSNGVWFAYRINIFNDRTKLSKITNPLTLRNLRFITDELAESSVQRRQASILGLNSSHILFAGVTKGSNAEIALLLWDIQYGVLLHSQMFPIPSTLDRDSLSFSVKLVQGSASQALLLLSPVAPKAKHAQLRTTVLVIPFSVPEASILANALGRAKAGATWLASEDLSSTQSADFAQAEIAKSQTDLLQQLQELVEEEKIEDADNLFFNWVRTNTEPTERRVKKEKKQKKQKNAPRVDGSSDDSAGEPEAQAKGAVGNKSKPTILNRKTILNHSFVSRILEISIHPESPATPYSPKILRFLLSRNLVSNSMLSGGVLPILLDRNDWDSIRECFHKMIDLTETDTIRTLYAVIKFHRKRTSDPDAMAVDSPNPAQVSTLPSFLATVVDYPASPVGWRNAIRQYMSDVEDLMSVLTVIDDWVAAWAEKDADLELGEVKPNEHGIPAPVQKVRKPVRLRGTAMPPMENILLFLQAILDSSFITLLQHLSSHALLRRLSENLSPQISFNTGLEPLVGPLAPFAKAQAKAIADAKGGGKREEVDWRKRRKQLQEQNAINLGPYQVEEIIF